MSNAITKAERVPRVSSVEVTHWPGTKRRPLRPELGEQLLADLSGVAADQAIRIAKSKEFQIKSMLDAAPQIARLILRAPLDSAVGDRVSQATCRKANGREAGMPGTT